MKNHQAPEGVVSSFGRTLLVHSVFPTIQGEGPFAGRPATFIRLAGCNLQCPLCDTEYTDGAKMREFTDLAAEVCGYGNQLVVITGGEPFRQNLSPLILQLNAYAMFVQVETNGKLAPQAGEDILHAIEENRLFVVISPKTHTINKFWTNKQTVAAYKYVVKDGEVAPDGLPIRALDHPVPRGTTIARPPDNYRGPVYVQPADEYDHILNARNTAQAIASVMRKTKQRMLCLQIHKFAGLD